MKKRIIIEGMQCENCVKHIKEAIRELEDVVLVEVNLEDGIAEVETEVEDTVLKEVIEEAGYDVVDIEID
jgi:copper chaperone